MPSLIILEGDQQGRVIELSEQPLSIGRDPASDLVVSDAGVSRRHAAVEFSNGVYFVRDLSSENGTFVNNVPVGRALLLDRDEIRIGSTRVIFVETVAAEDVPPSFRTLPVLERSEESEDFFIDAATEVAPKSAEPATDDLQQAYDRLKTIYAMMRSEADSRRPAQRIESAVALARNAIEADRLTLIEQDAAAPDGWRVRYMATATGVSSRNRIAISRTVFAYVEKERKPFFCSNPQSDRRVGSSDSLRQSGIRSVLCVPLIEGERVAGLLYADNFVSREPFGKEDLDFVAAVGTLIAGWLREDRAAGAQSAIGAGAVLAPVGRHTFVTQNARMKQILEVVHKVARSDTTFLITGESGTGKELIARMAHLASPRARGPFVCVNCAALPDTLLESELFGHEKGAYTGAVAARAGKFEAARGGTIFLDEIGDISPAAQAKVLRVLQEKEIERLGGNRPIAVDVRVIAATNKNLAEEIRAGRFREDLFYRLNVIRIELPPLRERLDDLPALVEFFIQSVGSELHSPVRRASREALDVLARYAWPGNVRELRNVIERAVVLGSDEAIWPDDLPPEVRGESVPPQGAVSAVASGNAAVLRTLDECEREHILRVLTHTGWNKKRAAEILGISRSALYEKIATYSLEAT
ncbi:MAG: sigma 54-interacting transcriptional regulator [Candidatus Sumerlaeia bacterium]|nr:sigma 54-interacting transcriptional regulator [Candidatus Sumerlaeia bacterium]